MPKKRVYILTDPAEEHFAKELMRLLREVGEESYGLELEFVHRNGLIEATPHIEEDSSTHFDLAIFSAVLAESDRVTIDRCKGDPKPSLDGNSFSILPLMRRIKTSQPACTMIVACPLEHRAITIFMLSEENNADWVFKPETLSESQVALWIALFLV